MLSQKDHKSFFSENNCVFLFSDQFNRRAEQRVKKIFMQLQEQ